jgi:hypothetical protein
VIREIPPEHEFIHPATEQRYNEIWQIMRYKPNIEKLRTNESVRQQIEEQRALENAVPAYGHVFKEHRVDERKLRARAFDGTRARDGAKRYRPAHATGFLADEASISAISVGWADKDTIKQRMRLERAYADTSRHGASPGEMEALALADTTAIIHVGPIERALGPDWRAYVEGYTGASRGRDATEFPPDTEVRTIWKMTKDGIWYAETCYPRPPERKRS